MMKRMVWSTLALTLAVGASAQAQPPKSASSDENKTGAKPAETKQNDVAKKAAEAKLAPPPTTVKTDALAFASEDVLWKDFAKRLVLLGDQNLPPFAGLWKL